jgi:hypothetical protein
MLTGGCMCGGVRWELTEPPGEAGYCHCTRCQRRTGTAASVSAQVVPGSLRVVQGAELVRDWCPPQGNRKVFCAACGSHLWSQHPEDEELRWIRLGGFDDDPGVTLEYHQFVAYAAAWEPVADDGLPRYPERRPSSPAA